MRRALLLSCALAIGLLPGRGSADAPPITPAPNPGCAVGPQENVRVPTRGGDVFVRIVKPRNCQAALTPKPPVILQMTPYAVLGIAPDITWVRRGYAYAVADVPGTGQSGGCWDYGGAREQAATYDLVQWLGTQTWSLGPVGMIGGSYDGTAAIMGAVSPALPEGPPPNLKTIVPQVAIGDWYGYSYHDGVRYFAIDPAQSQALVVDEQGFDTPAVFDLGLGLVPPVRDTEPGSQDRIAARLCPGGDKVWHLSHGYSIRPDKDAFWTERDYTARAGELTDVTVLVQGGWRDYNVKHSESTRFFEAIAVDDPNTAADEGVPFKMLMMGQVGHDTLEAAFDPLTVLRAWFDKWLLGYDSNIDEQPPVWTRANDGVLRKEASWPAQGVADVRLFPAAGGGLSSSVPGSSSASYVDTGTGTEAAALRAIEGTLFFESAPLAADLRIEGMPRLELDVATAGTQTHFTPVLFDLGPPTTPAPQCVFPAATAACTITRGFLDTRYRNGLASGADLTPLERYRATVRFIDNDWVVPAGHRIGLAIMSSNAWWAVPNGVRARNEVFFGPGSTTLVLPVAGGTAAATAAGL